MPLRYSNYVGLSLDEILRDPKLNEANLPMILPIVIYNGLQEWNAPTKMSTPLGQAPDYLMEYQPQFKYLLLDFRNVLSKGFEAIDTESIMQTSKLLYESKPT